MSKKLILAMVIPATLMMGSSIEAAIPDAGSLSVELNKERQRLPSTGEAVVEVDLAPTNVVLSDTKVKISEVIITGQDIYSQATLQAIIAED